MKNRGKKRPQNTFNFLKTRLYLIYIRFLRIAHKRSISAHAIPECGVVLFDQKCSLQ